MRITSAGSRSEEHTSELQSNDLGAAATQWDRDPFGLPIPARAEDFGWLSRPAPRDDRGAAPADSSPADLADALFARLDEVSPVRELVVASEDAGDDQERQTDESDDGLDLWSLLYGLE